MNEMKLVSIPDADSPNFNALLALPGKKLRRIWAISAYYDHLSIKQLIEYMSDHGARNANLELIIVLDRRAGVDKYLKKLDKKIKKKFGSGYSGIYLSPFGELFHSKRFVKVINPPKTNSRCRTSNQVGTPEDADRGGPSPDASAVIRRFKEGEFPQILGQREHARHRLRLPGGRQPGDGALHREHHPLPADARARHPQGAAASARLFKATQPPATPASL